MATAPAKKTTRPSASPSNGEAKAEEAKAEEATAGSKTRKPAVAATPWGASTILEEVSVPQRSGERRFAVVVQLLESETGERLIRFAYTTSGTTRRGPVTMRARDLERLRAALERAPVLQEALRL